MSALVYCPFPDAESAAAVGRQLLDENLIGCINIGSPIRSLFVWEGVAGSAEEVPALFKTDERVLARVIGRLEDLHPYDSPAILGWPCQAADTTRAWLGGLVEGSANAAE